MNLRMQLSAAGCLLAIGGTFASATAEVRPRVGLALVAENLMAPVLLVSPPDGSDRRFVVDQNGQVLILNRAGEAAPELFLDIQDRMVVLTPEYDERGLLGFCFHPDFASNGRFFVFYSTRLRDGAPADWDHTNRVSEFTVSSDNSNLADMDSERVILEQDWPYMNHNGGAINFGPDGFLYIPFGDGGNSNDQGRGHSDIGNAQDVTNLLGDILRVDVDQTAPYTVPTDNPFMGRDGRDEIFAYGFRNPYRMSFDMAGSHQLYVGDAGQNLWEEIDVVSLGGNYGWNLKEGSHCFDPDNASHSPLTCPGVGYRNEPLMPPIAEYKNGFDTGGIGSSVIGGYVYRGTEIPELAGRYLFGDFSRGFKYPDGSLLTLQRQSDLARSPWNITEVLVDSETGRLGHFVKGFGQDSAGEIYVMTSDVVGPMGNTGQVYQLVPASHGSAIASIDGGSNAILDQVRNHPNPFRQSTQIEFAVDRATVARVQVYDLAGRSVRSLFDGPVTTGRQSLVWDGRRDDGRSANSGVYFCRIALQGGATEKRQMFLLR